MSGNRKKPKADLRKYYTVFLELGLVVTLLLFIVAMKVEIRSGGSDVDYTEEQEVVEMKEVVRTQQQKQPPPPPRPQVPVEVPNDQVIDDDIQINLDSDLDFDEPLPEPPPKEEAGSGQKEKIFVAVEQQPQLIGGIGGLQKKVEYPASCRRANIEGRVIVQFVVNEKGEVVNPEVIRGIGGGCDEAALKAVKEFAKFKPGRQRGQPVKVQFSLPILFRLQ